MPPGDKVTVGLPKEETWTLFNATRAELPEVLLVSDTAREFSLREIFVWHLSIIIVAVDLAEQGMPAPDEQELLNEIGEEIEGALKAAKTEFGAPNILPFARSTWNGERELIFRVHNAEIADAALQGLLASKEWERDWDFRMEEDFDWALTAPITALYPTN